MENSVKQLAQEEKDCEDFLNGKATSIFKMEAENALARWMISNKIAVDKVATEKLFISDLRPYLMQEHKRWHSVKKQQYTTSYNCLKAIWNHLTHVRNDQDQLEYLLRLNQVRNDCINIDGLTGESESQDSTIKEMLKNPFV